MVMNTAEKAPRPRLNPIDRSQELLPFVRATALDDISLYWIPVRSYPLPALQRRWLLEFLRRLKLLLAAREKLREECFLLFKSLSSEVVNRFTASARQHIPTTGMLLTPGETPPAPPDFEQSKAEAAECGKKGVPFDVARLVPDYGYWFLSKNAEAQREEFFGYGGMFMLYLKADPATEPPPLRLPKLFTSHPSFSPRLADGLAAAYSMKDGFLEKSKELFGEPFRDDPSYEGLPFVLPLLSSTSFVEATTEQRAQWFEVFDGYCIESRKDKGVLLALRDPGFDDALIEILKAMEGAGETYRL